jgi:hypothetical protein
MTSVNQPRKRCEGRHRTARECKSHSWIRTEGRKWNFYTEFFFLINYIFTDALFILKDFYVLFLFTVKKEGMGLLVHDTDENCLGENAGYCSHN